MIAALLVLLVPYAITILYAMPSTDDFWMGIGVERSSVIADAFQKACDFWMGWGGMWIYEFFRTLLNPVVLFGASSSLAGVELLLFFCGFLVAMWSHLIPLANPISFRVVRRVENPPQVGDFPRVSLVLDGKFNRRFFVAFHSTP